MEAMTSPGAQFVHLHTHSDFSLMESTASVAALVRTAKKLGMEHLALTDTGNLFALPEFIATCRAEGIKPIIGCEFEIEPLGQERQNDRAASTTYRVTLLAMDENGYRNLVRLSSRSCTGSSTTVHPLSRQEIIDHADGLIALSGCLPGEISQIVLHGYMAQAEQVASVYQQAFGTQQFYLELQDHGLSHEKRVNTALIELSRSTGIPLVATNDVHFIDSEDAMARNILRCIGAGIKLEELPDRYTMSKEYCFKGPQRMRELFREIPEAMHNTIAIAERCGFSLPDSGPTMPAFPLPDGHSTPTDYLRALVDEGLRNRYGSPTWDIRDRAGYELDVIESKGLSAYFLIYWDIVRFARTQGIPLGPGRDGAPGSLVAYALGITDIDPVQFGLCFETLLNPDRIDTPRISIDIGQGDRQKVINYLSATYGRDHAAGIVTFGTFKPRATIRDVSRVLGIPFSQADSIARLIPGNPRITLREAITRTPELQKLQSSDETYSTLLRISQELEGLHRATSTVASHIALSRDILSDSAPTFRHQQTIMPVTQFGLDTVEDHGPIAIGILGMKVLSFIAKVSEMIRDSVPDFDIDRIPLNDRNTYQLLASGDTEGVFQFESSTMRFHLAELKPSVFTDLMALNALYRPGLTDELDRFLELLRADDTEPEILPPLNPVLEETRGMIVYREQWLQVVHLAAGYSLAKADIMRRSLSSGHPQIRDVEREKFINGAGAQGIRDADASRLFDMLCLNATKLVLKSHSAAYTLLGYRTAYLKAHFPHEFASVVGLE